MKDEFQERHMKVTSKCLYIIAIAFAVISLNLPQTKAATVAPSFSCPKASAPLDKIICKENNLSVLDYNLSKTYLNLLNRLTLERRRTLVVGEREWLRLRAEACLIDHKTLNSNRNISIIAECISKLYNSRLGELMAEPVLREYISKAKFFAPLAIKEFPYRGDVENIDAERLLDLPLENTIELNVSMPGIQMNSDFKPRIAVTCRDWLSLTTGGFWAPSDDIVGEHIGEINDATCRIVNLVRKARSPLHSHFTGDDALDNIGLYSQRADYCPDLDEDSIPEDVSYEKLEQNKKY